MLVIIVRFFQYSATIVIILLMHNNNAEINDTMKRNATKVSSVLLESSLYIVIR